MENIPITDKDSTTKKCPMCAEEIPFAAVTCEFCSARFKVARAGYCQNCHTVHEADANDCCIRCGTALVDTQTKSEYIEQDGPSPSRSISGNPPPIETIQPKKKGAGRVLLWLGMSLILVGAYFVAFQYVQPALTVFLATETPRPTVTPRPTSTSTATPTLKPTRTPTPTPVEVDFTTIHNYPVDRQVIIIGQLGFPSNSDCVNEVCGLLLLNPTKNSERILLAVYYSIAGNTPLPNQMARLPNSFNLKDFKVRLDNGDYVSNYATVRITGLICDDTGEFICSISKIEAVH